ncbi:HlyD family secretion protein [Granulicella pectinivorans]|jgi:HlyD family secretion protein|uniref:HlyD family secretion protein n=1 Tax=Granulicella pectinivorans TaxID=474950 RepID=A0A1I6MML2_9BACT|nr:efflux RND transporter periplasmic adaptor subunit [Granulicella pectinivorans]SFS16891.1 HlyD family secretion protein [Granulicella pectinivorans]
MQTIESKRSNTPLVSGIAIVILIAAIFGFRHFTREIVEVKTAPVSYQDLVSSVPTNGKIEPIEEWQAHAPNAGVVKHIDVEIGDKVKAGTLVVQMDDTDARARVATALSTLRSAESAAADMSRGGTQDERIGMSGDLDRAKLAVAQDTKSLATLQQLQQHGSASANEIAAAQQRLSTDESNLASIQRRSTSRYGSTDLSRSSAQVADAKAQLAAAQAQLAAVNQRTPIAGTVYAIPVSEYDFVTAGEDLLDIADLDRIQIRAYFDEPEIGRLQPNQPVEIRWEAKPGQTWHGHVERPPTTVITYGTRNVGECIITVDDAHGDLLPNTNVNVKVTTAQRMHALSIPREALHTDGGDHVFRVVDGRLSRTNIQVGPATNLTRVEVLSGLSDKDIVVLNATTNRDLTDGLEVKTVQ